MKINTTRFGHLEVDAEEVITFPEGIIGFDTLKKFCLVDPGDDTLILWLQSLENGAFAFPVLEPKIFKPDYIVKLSAVELKGLQLANVNQSVVFNILTIPANITELTANLKAPIVINLRDQIGKQVVLQENEYSLKHLMFKELKAHLLTIESSKQKASKERTVSVVPINLRQIVPSTQVKNL